MEISIFYMESLGGRLVVYFWRLVVKNEKAIGFLKWGPNFTVHPIFWNFIKIPFLIIWLSFGSVW